jgi:hypothetical protein
MNNFKVVFQNIITLINYLEYMFLMSLSHNLGHCECHQTEQECVENRCTCCTQVIHHHHHSH